MKKTILITGATDGLGKSLALACAKEQYQLAICGRSKEKMEQLKKELGPASYYSECFDITDKEAFALFIEKVIAQFDFIDVLINNAGANIQKARVADMDEDDLIGMFQLNCLSHFRAIKAIYPYMKERGTGHIINILSSCCLYNNETMAGYTASKQAMNAISQTLTKEALEDNIRVTSFYPGGIDTNFRSIDRPDYLDSNDVATILLQLLSLPESVQVQEYVVRPRVEKNF